MVGIGLKMFALIPYWVCSFLFLIGFVHFYSLLGLSTHRNVKSYPAMTKEPFQVHVFVVPRGLSVGSFSVSILFECPDLEDQGT